MKRATHAGRTHLTFTGVELLRKLAPLIPPPCVNLTRYHGVFAPGSKRRSAVVILARSTKAPAPAPLPLPVLLAPTPKVHGPYRIPWADLLKRSSAPTCWCARSAAGPMQVVACIHDRDAVRKVLRHLHLPDTALPLSKARGPPQPMFDW